MREKETMKDDVRKRRGMEEKEKWKEYAKYIGVK